MARVSFEQFFKNRLEGKTAEINEHGVDREVDDVSFVHMRLGDLLLASESYKDAETEFQTALDLREQHMFPKKKLKNCLVSLGQAQWLGLRAKEGLVSFTRALEYINDDLDQPGSLTPEERKSCLEFVEDLELQIADVSKALEEGLYQKAKEAQKIASTEGKSSASTTAPEEQHYKMEVLNMYNAKLPETTSQFDASVLNGEVVNLGVVSKKRKVPQASSTADKPATF
eukprot:GHVP01014722.1.p2 GENE.GHVP01014722.1~~GHVP01014722.1.p2  ORF type:complete len:228 (-),score=44.73 GHVP01014722.1:1757-2440(-)